MRIPEPVECRQPGGSTLRVRFDDGVEGEFDLTAIARSEGVFAPLADPARIGEVRIDTELGTLAWPQGPDPDPLVVYAAVRRCTVGQFLAGLVGAAG